MLSLNKYYLYFFLSCLTFTIVSGMLAPMIPNAIAQVLIALPYIIAMITVLYIFLKQQFRAPTQSERVRLSIGYTIVLVVFNVLGVAFGAYVAAQQDPQIWQDFLFYIQNKQFLMLVLPIICLLLMFFFLLTYWFHGKQAQRMAKKMFG